MFYQKKKSYFLNKLVEKMVIGGQITKKQGKAY